MTYLNNLLHLKKIMRQTNNKNRLKTKFFIRNKAGFSFVELMVVLGILAIVAAIAVPDFIIWVPSYRLKSSARNLYSDMQKAKISAIKSNTTVSFNFTPCTGNPCQGGSYTFIDGTGVTIASESLTNGIGLSTPTSFPAGFTAKGLPSGATGTIWLNHPDTTRTYVITQSMAGSCKLQ